MKYSVLVVDDERNTREGLRRAIQRDYDVFVAEDARSAMEVLAEHHVDVMLSDVRMPGGDGLSLLREVRAKYPDVACILLTAYGSVETAVEAMKSGASDFLTKPVNLDHLDILLKRTIRNRSLESENRELRKQLDSKFGLENIIGGSPAMERLFDVIKQVAPSQATVLIQGPSGTGKELVAHAIHTLSPRASGPFVAVHCAALSSTLLESELFGHEKGAFTGAVSQRKGRFEMAEGGTLFLDEISEIEPSVQVKLLRVLEERCFERVGGDEMVNVDIRIVSATNRDLRKYVEEGKFREDLYYRLAVVDIRMPPLKERTSDIPMLCDFFIREFAGKNNSPVTSVSPAAIAVLQSYSWPGNVRELRNTVERMVVFARGSVLDVDDVPQEIRNAAAAASSSVSAAPATAARNDSGMTAPEPGGHAAPGPLAAAPAGGTEGRTLSDMERSRILEALASCGGNRSKAAEMLGISRRTLHRKINSFKDEGIVSEWF